MGGGGVVNVLSKSVYNISAEVILCVWIQCFFGGIFIC